MPGIESVDSILTKDHRFFFRDTVEAYERFINFWRFYMDKYLIGAVAQYLENGGNSSMLFKLN